MSTSFIISETLIFTDKDSLDQTKHHMAKLNLRATLLLNMFLKYVIDFINHSLVF